MTDGQTDTARLHSITRQKQKVQQDLNWSRRFNGGWLRDVAVLVPEATSNCAHLLLSGVHALFELPSYCSSSSVPATNQLAFRHALADFSTPWPVKHSVPVRISREQSFVPSAAIPYISMMFCVVGWWSTPSIPRISICQQSEQSGCSARLEQSTASPVSRLTHFALYTCIVANYHHRRHKSQSQLQCSFISISNEQY